MPNSLGSNFRQHRLAADGLLVGMAALLVSTYAMGSSWPVMMLQASAKAGVVGGLADWFAITALFKKPLGLPIPHTGIIPEQKERIGAAIADFIADDLLTENEILPLINRIDAGSIVLGLLDTPEARQLIKDTIIEGIPAIAGSAGNDDALDIVSRFLPALADGSAPSLMASRILGGVLESGKHKPLVRTGLTRIRKILRERENEIKTSLNSRIKEQGGAVVGWLAGDKMSSAIITALDAELDESGPMGGAIRDAADRWLREEIYRFHTDPMRAYEIGELCRTTLKSPEVRNVMNETISRLKTGLMDDMSKPDGVIATGAESIVSAAINHIKTSDVFSKTIQKALENIIKNNLDSLRFEVRKFIGEVMNKWDTKTLVTLIENKVGADLQFIRMNGTIVGFLAGGILYALLKTVFGSVNF